MAERLFRKLKASEIETKVKETYTNGGIALAIYKDARVDANILDETFGPMDWKKEYSNGNRNCVVSIWDKEKSQWISKEDTGEGKDKALASDSFKRACFAWGIGRELYTGPHIYFSPNDISEDFQQKPDRFEVTAIEYDEDTSIIVSINVLNVTTGVEKNFTHENDKKGGMVIAGEPRVVQQPKAQPKPQPKAQPKAEQQAEASPSVPFTGGPFSNNNVNFPFGNSGRNTA